MKITAVERDKTKKDTYSVYVDGEYAFSVNDEAYFGLNLYPDRELTGEELKEITGKVNLRSAKSVAIKFLSLKLRSSGEVVQKLKESGYSGDVITGVMDELSSLGYINDSMYVQKYIFDRSKLKPKSKKMLKLELLHKGISEDTIDGVLDEYVMDEAVTVESLIRKKFGKYDLNDEKIVKKLYSFLHHRGYSFELITEVLSSIKRELG